MFDELLGLPAHPLLLHAAVVFGPLLVAAVVAYCVVPPLRRYLGWVVVLLSVAAPLSLWFARLSGENLKAKLLRQVAPDSPLISRFDEHQNFGNLASWYGTALGVLGILTVLVCVSASRKPASTSSKIMTYGLIVLSLVAAGVTGYYVFKTGDTGAHLVWGS